VDSFERGKQRRHQGDLYQLRTSLQQIRYRKLRVPALGRVGSGRPGRTAWPCRARRNVAHHYDLPEELYRLFLDDDMQYSCAYFREPGMSLERAQIEKKGG
jgi:hypothetical protein